MSLANILNDDKLKHFVTPEEVPVALLDCAKAFAGLDKKEKLYAHYISEASWAGVPVVLTQASEESLGIYKFILNSFGNIFAKETNPTAETIATMAGISSDDAKAWIQYSAMFLGNMGNYKSFGDTKFIPRVPADAVAKIAQATEQTALFDQIKVKLYSLNEEDLELGFGSGDKKTNSGYYTSNVTQADAELVSKFLEKQNISGINTRLFKNENGFLVLIASAETGKEQTYDYEGNKITVRYGDFADSMAKVAANLEQAIKFSANDHQKKMHECYVTHFKGGNIADHEDSQRHWIRDKGPVVECNIGFIESYRDPLHLRAEWEGFVAVVNKEMSAKFNALVDNAEPFIKKLPWNDGTSAFEKDKFHRPDFTSLEVLCFASSGIPAGINIPNYDSIRQTEGFKNVSLGNVLNAASTKEELTFIPSADFELFYAYRGKAFEVQVGLHELLGHGSGKLLSKNEDGTFNFDKNLINPLTNQPVATYYEATETYNGKFGEIASSYEECRAESVGIYLCVIPEILKIFGFEGEEAENVMYINWLLMCRAGVLALEFYNPESKKWGQAHMQARFAILRVLLEAGQGFVTLVNPGTDNVYVQMDKSKIKSVGVPTMATFLSKLNIYKAIADDKAAKEMYKKYTTVDDTFVQLRQTVMNKKKPRRVFVQQRTVLQGDDVQLISYEATPVGLIRSFVDRNIQ